MCTVQSAFWYRTTDYHVTTATCVPCNPVFSTFRVFFSYPSAKMRWVPIRTVRLIEVFHNPTIFQVTTNCSIQAPVFKCWCGHKQISCFPLWMFLRKIWIFSAEFNHSFNSFKKENKQTNKQKATGSNTKEQIFEFSVCAYDKVYRSLYRY